MWQTNTLSMHTRGAGALFLSAFIYATYGPLVRIIAVSLSDYAQVTLRFALAALVVVVWYWATQRSLPSLRLPYRSVIWSLTLGLAFGAMALCTTEAVLHTKIGTAIFLLYAGTIITSVTLGTLVHHEPLTRGKIIAITLSSIGLLLFAAPSTTPLLWIVVGFMAGVGDGVANVIRKTLRDAPRASVLFYQFAVCAIMGAVALAFNPTVAVTHVTFAPIAALIAFACLQALLGNLLLYGFSHFDVNAGTIILACELLFAALFGFVFFHETLTIFEVIGGLCIASGAVVVAAQ